MSNKESDIHAQTDSEYMMSVEDILNAIDDGILTNEEAKEVLEKMGAGDKSDKADKGYMPDVRMPDMSLFNPIQTGPRGGSKIDMAEIGRFFKSCHICYDNRWMMYDGRIYSPISDADIDTMIYRICSNAVVNGMVFVPQTNELNSLVRYLKQTLTPSDVVAFPPNADEQSDYSTDDGAYNIVFSNGVLHVRDRNRVLLDFTPYIYNTNMVHAEYKPHIPDDKRVIDILINILPDKDTFTFFMEMVGYILYARVMNPPAIFLLYGPGNTGKTALHRMIAHVVGEENVSTLGLTQITSRFGTAELNGKLLNICGETGSQSRRQTGIDGELLKKLTDGQVVTVEEKGKKPYQMRNTAKLLFVSNTPPDFGDYSSGMNRRMYTILCNKPQDPTKDIYAPLTTDTAQTWLAMRQLDAYIEWIARKNVFSVSLSMKEEGQMQAQEDPIKFAFIELFGTTEPFKVRAMVVTDDVLCIVAELYKAVRTIWLNNGIPPFAIMSQHKFTARVRTDYYMSIKVKRVSDGLNGTKPMRVYVIPDSEIRLGEEVAE